jgi:hypothetical protein
MDRPMMDGLTKGDFFFFSFFFVLDEFISCVSEINNDD